MNLVYMRALAPWNISVQCTETILQSRRVPQSPLLITPHFLFLQLLPEFRAESTRTRNYCAVALDRELEVLCLVV